MHLQHAKKTEIRLFIKVNNLENYYLSLVNIEKKSTSIQIFLNDDTNQNIVFDRSLEGFTSKLIKLNNFFSKKIFKKNELFIIVKMNGFLRRCYLIEDTISKAISIDHV